MSKFTGINATFARSIEDFETKVKSKIQKIDKAVVIGIGKKLVQYSAFGDPSTWKSTNYKWPKGYTPGHFILNWQVGIDSPPVGEIKGTNMVRKDAETIAIERLSHLGRWTVGHKYYFVNNVPYGKIIDDGLHSYQVPPPGIIARVRQEYPQIVKKAIAEVG